jgi:hypothetical protein
MIMEYCEKGSLERGIASGQFQKADNSPDMVSWEASSLCWVVWVQSQRLYKRKVIKIDT